MAGTSPAPEAPKQAPAAKEGAKPSASEEKEPPPPDTRTWLQKNWIFMVPVVMIVCPHRGMHARSRIFLPRGLFDTYVASSRRVDLKGKVPLSVYVWA